MRAGGEAGLPGAGSPQTCLEGEQGILPGRSQVLLLGAGRMRTEWQGELCVCDIAGLIELANGWLEQRGSCPRGAQLLSISHQGSGFRRAGIYFVLLSRGRTDETCGGS